MTKLCKYSNTVGLSTIAMHLANNGIGYIQGFLPKYQMIQEFPKQFHIYI